MTRKSKEGSAFDFTIFIRLMGFAKLYPVYFFIASFSTILLAVVSAAFPYTLILTIDDFTVYKDGGRLLNYTLFLLLLMLSQVVLQFVFIYFANWVGQHIVRDIRSATFEKIINFKMKYFNQHSVGKLVTRVVSDIETIANFFTHGVFLIISDLLKMLIVIFVMLYVNWQLALIALSILPLLIIATRIFQKAIKKTFKEVRNQVANLNGFVQERVTGMQIVQLFNREKIEYRKFKEINIKFKEANIKTVWYYSIFFPIAEILASIAVGLIVWYGALQAIVGDDVKVGEVIGFISMAQMLFRPLRQIADKFNQLQMGIVSGERVFDVLDTEEAVDNSGTLEALSLNGIIKFDKVRFSYNKGQEILKGISFDVAKGQTIAIVGATGAGKSTVINLLSRLYEFDSGTIAIDGKDIRDYKLMQLRKQIGVVLQDVFLFSDTILNNITLKDKGISFDEVVVAAKKIGIHDFILSLPGGYEYLVKERGAMLSSGQRQLIAFLRAYISNPTILVLDEATSLVDTNSEKMIQYATNQLTRGRTTIVIAHRLATIRTADLIIVMDKGLIVEQGSHQELIVKESGYYKALFEKQFTVNLS